jgi:DNA-binding NarL/FixJ family response regulator
MPGIKGYIHKPFSLERLVEAINQAMEAPPAKSGRK